MLDPSILISPDNVLFLFSFVPLFEQANKVTAIMANSIFFISLFFKLTIPQTYKVTLYCILIYV